MCRALMDGGRRCPEHPLTEAERRTINATRRATYATQKHNAETVLVSTLIEKYQFPNVIHEPVDEGDELFTIFNKRFEKLKLTKEEQKVLYDYTTMDFKKIRQNISRRDEQRNVSVSFSKAKREELNKKVQVLDKVFSKLKPFKEPVTVFRGWNIPPHQDVSAYLAETFVPGTIWADKTYMSTSLNADVAVQFPNHDVKAGHKIMFEIITDNGLPVPRDYTFMNGEAELLLARKNKFVVAEVIPNSVYEWKMSKDDTEPYKTKATVIRLIDTNLYKGDK